MFFASSFIAMIGVSPFYFSELGALGLAKYWGVFIAIALVCSFIFHGLFMTTILLWFVVIAAVIRANSSDVLS